MSKNKTINRVISNIVFSGLLVSILPVSLPLYGQAQQTEERKKLKMEVDQEVKKIKMVVNSLNAAKIAAPLILAGAGAVITGMVAALVALLFTLPSRNLKKAIDSIGKGEWKSSVEALLETRTYMTTKVYTKSIQKIREKFLVFLKQNEIGLKRIIKKFPQKFISAIGEYAVDIDVTTNIHKLLYKTEQLSEQLKKLDAHEVSIIIKALKDIKDIQVGKVPHNKILKSVIKDVLGPARKNLLYLGSAVFVGAIIAGLVGTATAALGSIFGLSAATVAAAFKGAKKIEQIKKEHPGIVTLQQERVLIQLRKLSKGLMSRSIIKGLRLEEARMAAANEAMQQYPALVKKLGGQKKARKTFASYIKRKWKEKFFETVLSEDPNFVKSIRVKLQLKMVKKKIAKLQTQYPQLKAALADSVQTYAKQADAILEELKQEMLQAAEKGELKLEKMTQPVISL